MEGRSAKSPETQCMEWALAKASKTGEIQEQDATTANVAWIEAEA